mmetsp:Transcript_6099/g.7887  ORF Transcript_6099/g.7887 Transcript_6099/m.7887 type:complete len:290 (+) Transcript_6099:89-958(+)
MTVRIPEMRSNRAKNLLSDVPRRLMTICIGVPILWMIWSLPFTRHLFFQGAHGVMCWEWGLLSKQEGFSRYSFLVVSLVLANIQNNDFFNVSLIFSVACFPFISGNFDPATVLSSTAGFLLLSFPNRIWLFVSNDFHATVSILLTVWNADTGALIAGRLGSFLKTNWPKPRWLQRISPAKSVEGLIGGLAGGILTFWSLPWFWMLIHRYGLAPHQEQISIWDTLSQENRLLVGLVLSVSAILGDLWESSLKRSFKVKDSGKLLPGHGGVLDRFDSSLLAVVVYYHILNK